jgi:hypothetical protein
MTKREALAKARILWGPKASVSIRRHFNDPRRGDDYGRYNVNSGTFACNDGKGKVAVWANSFVSWEDAFERAKTRYKYWENA